MHTLGRDGVGVGANAEQVLDDCSLFSVRGDHQGSVSVAVSDLDIGALLNQKLH